MRLSSRLKAGGASARRDGSSEPSKERVNEGRGSAGRENLRGCADEAEGGLVVGVRENLQPTVRYEVCQEVPGTEKARLAKAARGR